MKWKGLQVFFFLALMAIATYFSISFSKKALQYGSLQYHTHCQILRWEIVPKGSKFALKAEYAFHAQEGVWKGSFLFPQLYLNEFAAMEGIKEKARGGWSVWYNPKNPSFSALFKSFPFGLLIRAVLCWMIGAYFWHLRGWLEMKSALK